MARSRRRKKSKASDIPVNSFSDIAFLLIIFFVIATKLVQFTGVLTEIPSGERTQASASKTPTIQLHNDKIVYNEQETDVATLRQRLQKMKLDKQPADKRIVMLESSGKVPYQVYYDVMCTISQAGGIIAIVTEEKDSKK